MTTRSRLLATLGSLSLILAAVTVGPDPAHSLAPATAAPFGSEVYLLADLEPGSDDSLVEVRAAAAGPRLVFQGTTDATGDEPFVTDGTRAGTRLLKDITPGPSSGSDAREVVAFKGRAWFAASDGEHGTELWVSDGTTAGTSMLTDLVPGAGSSSPIELTPIGGQLWFAAETAGGGNELHVTDGTPAGTRRVADIVAGSGGSAPNSFTALGSRVLFAASTPETGRELFVTDGTTASLFLDIRAGAPSSFPGAFARLGARTTFVANDGVAGSEPWVTDGTPTGTGRLRDVEPGVNPSSASAVVALPDGTGVFSAISTSSGRELWATDGTPGGTQQLYDLAPGPSSGSPRALTAFGGAVYFIGQLDGSAELWRTRGTAASTVPVTPVGSNLEGLSLVAGRLLTSGETASGRQVLLSDGTAAGTAPASDFTSLSSAVVLGQIGNTAIINAEETAGAEPYALTIPTTTTTAVPRKQYAATVAAKKQVRVPVRVRTSSGVPAAGRVSLLKGTVVLGTATVVDGTTTVRITRPLGVGVHRLRARYDAGITGRASTSKTFVVRVVKPRRR